MRLFLLLAVTLLVVGCGGGQALVPHSVELVTQTEIVPEEELLDVGVVVFDSGVPEGEVEKEVEEKLRDDGGRYTLNRLPSEDDPQFERVRSVRDREHLFVETLNEHYVDFYERSKDPYRGWRETAREEAVAIRDSRSRIALGILSMIASALYGLGSDGDLSDRVATDTLMHMSTGMIESGFLRREEKQLHIAALEELSVGFDAELEPMVVEIDGIQHRFTGTAEAQYEEWRELLRQIFQDETGLSTVQMHTG